jgi:hypothetical protein
MLGDVCLKILCLAFFQQYLQLFFTIIFEKREQQSDADIEALSKQLLHISKKMYCSQPALCYFIIGFYYQKNKN